MVFTDGAGDSASSPELVDTERAVFGPATVAELRGFLSRWAAGRLGSPIADVVFRAGRIDIVWGVRLVDGREVVIKIHRPPVDEQAIAVTHEAQQALALTGFPCAAPLVEPGRSDGHLLTAETLVVGQTPNGHDPADRLLLAAGLAEHIEILRQRPGLTARTGRGPSWCHYQEGPWPVPHDTLVDFATTPAGYAWLDDFARQTADQILANRDGDQVVIGHADWYGGNTAVADGRLVGTFDWELVADTEAVIAGFAASCYAASSSGPGGLSTPEEAAAFLRDYDSVRSQPLTDRERRTAAGAAAWIAAFNARWQVGLIDHGMADQATIVRARDQGRGFLSLDW